MAESLKSAGAPQKVIQKVLRENDTGPEVQPANEITVSLFYKCSTQWTHAGMTGARTGLNYTAVEARARALPDYRELTPELQDRVWDGLQRMEIAAIKQWQSKTR